MGDAGDAGDAVRPDAPRGLRSLAMRERGAADRRAERSGSLGRATLADAAAERIRWAIFDGELRPGERINIDALAADFGVSRVPIRDALISLTQDGVVALSPHKGCYVGDFDENVLRDHFEILGMVQALAAEHFAREGSPEALARLGEIIEQLRKSNDAHRVRDLGNEFHRIMNSEGGSARQRAVLRGLGRMLPTGFVLELPNGTKVMRSGPGRIYDAMLRGDSAEIRTACAAVQHELAELVIAHLRRKGVLTSSSSGKRSAASRTA
jgi:DNA-binding GntR family transcriptional regulator